MNSRTFALNLDRSGSCGLSNVFSARSLHIPRGNRALRYNPGILDDEPIALGTECPDQIDRTTSGHHCDVASLNKRSPIGCKAAGCRVVSHNESVALALIEYDDQLVLIQRTKAPLAGYWIPPAGHVEIGESVPQAVVREAREESGLEISLDGLVGIYSERERSNTKSRMVITAFRSHSVGGVPVAGDDAGDIALFRRGQLPDQPPPEWGTSRDYWVYGVIQSIFADWR